MIRDFFFQAEDGIRDGRVTGVQTCALPISGATWCTATGLWTVCTVATGAAMSPAEATAARERMMMAYKNFKIIISSGNRSEERRVGKECRTRWSTYL